jgi:hypothetical protein
MSTVNKSFRVCCEEECYVCDLLRLASIAHRIIVGGALQAMAPKIFDSLAVALIQCVSIVGVGYACHLFRIFSHADVDGLSRFVARVALPSLILVNMSTLDLSSMTSMLTVIAAVLLAKALLFAIVVTGTALTALHSEEEHRSLQSLAWSRQWMRRAGLNAIFATQSNDFALGLPLLEAIWPGQFTSVIFVIGVAQLAILNPIAFVRSQMAVHYEPEPAPFSPRVRLDRRS